MKVSRNALKTSLKPAQVQQQQSGKSNMTADMFYFVQTVGVPMM